MRLHVRPALHKQSSSLILITDTTGPHTGLVVLDASSNTVIKKPFNEEESSQYVELERRIYERLTERGGHDGLLRYHGVVENGIRLEFAPHLQLKSCSDERERGGGPDTTRLRWIIQVAEALRFLHDAGIIHGDLTSANVLLDAGWNAKVADFAGSSLDGSPLLVASPASYQCPESNTSVKGDIFAFGSLVYEIMTGQEPYQGRDGGDIRLLFASKTFPDITHLGDLGRIIEKCWHGRYSGCDSLVRDLKGIVSFFLSRLQIH
ncbi:kinase-like protein [Sodiomyces alkalinus F11]|uniref:EKC/KEOPS complex subunit BUD32 n=1 Tax=Sodiomyces alkalinus (strain CBS 110278 / VKM F-3762 / F11) TaxID=1314773 RepID=A0A3N2PPP4_SODAK|nr:kinase-like protein [Sodiomyces alkalinus F11]ROT36410.1 kinase-like protein [Sodiomyces alkalinus F11]